MARKVRFRLWFHKLNIKRFSNTSHPIKRRSLLSSPPHALDILGRLSSTSAPPLQALHSSSSPDHISVSLLSSPCHSLPVTFSSPRHSLPATFSSPLHSLPAISLPRHGRKAFKPSKHQANFSSSVLLSPINCKALDIPFPSGGSSPAPAYTFMQSPTLQAVVAMSPAVKIFSPPICKPHTVLFKSPLHTRLAYHNSDNHSINPEAISTTQASRGAKFSARASRKAEISVNSCADCFASQSQAEEESNLITARHRMTAQQRSTRANCRGKQSPLIVDCGCHPSFSSSFRKTKKTLQSCGSCSSNKPGIIPSHNNLNTDATQKHDMLGNVKSSLSGGESKNSINCCRENTCSVSAKQDHKKLQLKKRKKRMDAVAEITAPINSSSLFKHQEFGHTIPLMIETFDANNRETKTKKGIENADFNPANLASSFRTSSTRDAALLMDARTLAWEKDFSSFTSEDTFFSSFERSRPSFSSNSSSECFDKKLSYSKPASNHSNLVSNDANVLINQARSSIKRPTDDLNCSNPAFSSSNACVPKDAAKVAISPVPVNTSQSLVDGHSLNKLQHTLRSMSCKGRYPLVEVSFHAVDVREDDEVALRGDTHICAEGDESEHRLRINNYHRMKRSSLNPLVEIKEDPCEGGSTDTVELDKTRSSRKSRSSLKELNLQEKLSSNPDYTSSCHSDYYANAHASLQRSARVRKKSNMNRSKGRDTGNARITRRRAHLQAKWRLSDEKIQWQSSVEDEDVDHDVGCATPSSQLIHPNLNEHGYMHTQNNFNMPRRRTQDIKQKHTELINASIEAPKADSIAPQNSALRTGSQAVDDSAPCGAAQVMRNISDNTASKCEAERMAKTGESPPNVNKQSSYANNPRLSDSVAVVKCSKDPLVDFRESMVDMIIEKQIYSAADLGELLQCFLSLNSCEHHDVIVQAFGQVWGKLFQES